MLHCSMEVDVFPFKFGPSHGIAMTAFRSYLEGRDFRLDVAFVLLIHASNGTRHDHAIEHRLAMRRRLRTG